MGAPEIQNHPSGRFLIYRNSTPSVHIFYFEYTIFYDTIGVIQMEGFYARTKIYECK